MFDHMLLLGGLFEIRQNGIELTCQMVVLVQLLVGSWGAVELGNECFWRTHAATPARSRQARVEKDIGFRSYESCAVV